MLIKHRRGVAALIIVTILASAGLLLAVAGAGMNLDSLSLSADLSGGSKALAWADGCLNLAERRWQLDNTYNGESLSEDGKSCIISLTDSGGQKVIRAVATVGDYSRAAQVFAQLNNNKISLTQYSYPEDY